MVDEAQSINEGFVISEEVRPEVVAFKESVAKADGTLLPLRKTTADGKRLYIAARHLRNPGNEPSEGVNPRFYGWEEDRSMPMTGVMFVEVYSEEDSKIVPLGHMDWWLSDDYANGGGNMHDARVPKQEHEELAQKQWHKHDYTAFKVDYNYHQQGMGSLMLATSAVILPALGVRNFFTGGLLEPAKKTYVRFGINDSDFPSTPKPFDRHLPIERLSQNPQVNKAIGEFV